MGKLLWGFLGLSAQFIENVESRRTISACLNPSYSIKHAGEVCSGNGYCQQTLGGPDQCKCNLVKKEEFYWTSLKRFFGKWCQCDPWNCIYTDLMDGYVGKVDFYE